MFAWLSGGEGEEIEYLTIATSIVIIVLIITTIIISIAVIIIITRYWERKLSS